MIDYFLSELKITLDSYFDSGSDTTPSIRWGVAAKDTGQHYIIKAQMNTEATQIKDDEPPPELRRLVIWTFSDDNKTAYIILKKPLDFVSFTAQLMTGHLFGQGMERERR
jgi:hypothetical protein